MTEDFFIVVCELAKREISVELVLLRQGFRGKYPARYFVKFGKGIQLFESRFPFFLFYVGDFWDLFFHIGKAKTDLLPAFTKNFRINVLYFCNHKPVPSVQNVICKN